MEQLNRLIALLHKHMDIVLPYRSSRWSNSGWTTPSPDMPGQFEITFALSGVRRETMRGASRDVHPGDVHFHDCAEACVCHPGKFAYAYMIFTLDRSHPAHAHVHRSLTELFRGLHLFRKERYSLSPHRVEDLFLHISRELIARSAWSSASAALLLLQLLIELQRSLRTKHSPSFNRYAKYSAMAADLIAYMEQHLDQELYLDQVAARYGLNARYLNRLFKGVTGKPIFQYRQTLKIDKAKRLLHNDAAPLIDIALELGFASSQYFSSFFKTCTGMTPTQYRLLSKAAPSRS